jgi:signal transduction histidine kinase/ActR/RegA family two-component response regulator
MKIKILFILFIFNSLYTFGYNVDSLKSVANQQPMEKRIVTLVQGAQFLCEHKKLSDAQSLADNALQLAEENNNQEGIAAAKEALALISFERFDATSAGKLLTEALRIRDESKNHKAIAYTKLLLGRVFIQQGDLQSAQQQLTRSIEMSLSVGDKIGVANAAKFLGDAYTDKKIFGKAKENYQRAMDIFIEAEQPEKAAAIANRLGNIVTELADYEGALTYFQTSLDLNTATNNLPNIAQDLKNLTKIYAFQGNFEEAKNYAERANGLFQSQNNQLGKAEIAAIMAKAYEEKGDKTNAISELAVATSLANQTIETPGVQNVFLQIADTYRALGMNDKAYDFLQQYNKVNEKIVAAEKNKALLEMTSRYENEFANRQKEQKITLLELEKSNSQKKIWMLLMLAIALSGVGFLLYKNYKIKQEDNLLLTSKNNEISEKNALLDDKNNILERQSASLEVMNEKLRYEMAEREAVEKSTFDKDSFLANVSNQMRTPINVISGLSHILLEQNKNTEQAEHLQTLQFSANSLLVFINDMLDYAKIEAGKLNPDFRPFEPHKLLNEVKERFTIPTQNKGIKLNFNVHEGLPTRISGDPARLNQILSNLLQFCNHTTSEGYIDVKIESIPVSPTDMHLEITVTDSGSGITQLEMDEMLRKFSYSIEDISGGMSQTGFGLAIMKRLVELQNGTVEGSSMEGLGSKFRVILPFKLIENQSVSKNKIANYAFPGAKVLLVEDNKINQMVVQKMLQKAMVRVTTAENGQVALEKISAEDFDLVLMDIQMPVMDGYRCTSEIRKLGVQEKSRIPIVALTASPFLTETEKAQLFGMDDYIGKPFSAEELMEKASKYLVLAPPQMA